MELAGGNQINQVHLEVLHLRVRLVAHVRLGLWQGSILCVASIHCNGRVDGTDNAVSAACDILHSSDEIRVVLGCKQMLDIRSISKPCNAMHMGTSSVLPLKPVPEVNCSHDISVECVHKLADAMVKEPVSDGSVVRNCLAATGTAVFLVWTAPLLEPELAGPSKAAGKAHHSMGEEFPLVAHHVTQIV